MSQGTLGEIKVHLFWAFACNVGAIPAAAFELMKPMLVGGAMPLACGFMIDNSLRLRRFRGTDR